MRGEAGPLWDRWPGGEGPSPHVRGSLRRMGRARLSGGSIPACAGKPRKTGDGTRPRWVHPRMCGEASSVMLVSPLRVGPSPHVRGSRKQGVVEGFVVGSIPACAGKPGRRPSPTGSTGVHPRMCGEALDAKLDIIYRSGPSPHVRGSPFIVASKCRPHRSIPACAGKPKRSGPPRRRRRVHPRMCGEATLPREPGARCWGPSPHVRGSPQKEASAHLQLGSIPACAGKPPCSRASPTTSGVHPRMCGEAAASKCLATNERGPSRMCGEATVD